MPVIGIPTIARRNRRGRPEHYMLGSYCAALTAAGGTPVLLPPADERLLRGAYERLDGLLLPGGGDVSPMLYGEANGGASHGLDPRRDAMELACARWALGDGLPILAICRGIQVLNVAAGGTLLQDIASQVGDAVRHSAPVPPERGGHTVQVAPGSRLAAIYADGGAAPATLFVNSRHHQCVARVAAGFVATAVAADGVVEAIEPAEADGHFCLGVQWHPEDLAPSDPATRRLFAAFREACARWQGRR